MVKLPGWDMRKRRNNLHWVLKVEKTHPSLLKRACSLAGDSLPENGVVSALLVHISLHQPAQKGREVGGLSVWVKEAGANLGTQPLECFFMPTPS